MSTHRIAARTSLVRTAIAAVGSGRLVVVGRRFRLLGSRRVELTRGAHLLLGVVPFEFDDCRHGGLVRVQGRLRIAGRAAIGAGARWHIGRDATVTLGDHTYFSPGTMLLARHGVRIGAGCALAWDVQIVDDDRHPLAVDGTVRRQGGPIILGDQVWVGARSSLLKGTRIADGCIVAAGSVVAGHFDEPHCLLAGVPARPVRRNVTWTR